MTTAAISGVGTTFERGDGASPEVFTAIAEINSVSGPTMSRGTIDVTSLDSTGGYREFIAGFRDPGAISLNMNFSNATYTQMKTDFESADTVNYQIVLPDTGTTTVGFAGLVTDLPLDVPLDDKITANITIKISGQVTLS